MPAEGLKEYLVNIGWSSDQFGLKDVEKGIESVSSGLKGLTKISGFASAGVNFAKSMVQAAASVWSLVSGVAEADREAQHFARRMWTTTQAAQAYQDAMEITGYTVDELWWSTNETFNQFMDLRNLSQSLTPPKGFEDSLKLIRSINHEIDRLKVIFKSATRWVTYYFMQLNGREAQDARQALRDFNDYLVRILPVVTQKVAIFFSFVFRLVKVGAQGIRMLIDLAATFFGQFDRGVLGMSAVMGSFFLLLKMGPIGWFIAALTAILLLLDDFLVWQRGGKSLLGDLWSSLSSFNGLLDGEDLKEYGSILNDILELFYELGIEIGETSLELVKLLDSIGAFELIKDVVVMFLTNVRDGLQDIVDLIKLLKGDFEGISENSKIRKILKFDEEGNISGFNTDVQGGLPMFLKKGLNLIGSSFKGAYNFGQDIGALFSGYKKGNADNTAASVTGFRGSTNYQTSQTQENNVNINMYGSSATPSAVGDSVSKSLSKNTFWKNPFQ